MNSSVYQHGHGIVMIPLKGPIVIMFIVMFIMNIVLVNFYCFSPRYKPNLGGEKTHEYNISNSKSFKLWKNESLQNTDIYLQWLQNDFYHFVILDFTSFTLSVNYADFSAHSN